MRELSFVGFSDDGSHLVLSATDGQRYTVRVDKRLSAAVQRDRSRRGQLEIDMDGGLSPKDIQARIRAGMSAEEVAAASGLPLDKVQRFEGAVLAERAYVAEKARGTTVRAAGGAAPLSEVVAARLTSRGVDPDTMRWDAWRRDDGRWLVHLDYGSAAEAQSASWTYDTAARSVAAGDDDARALVDDKPAVVAAPVPVGPRLVPVPDAVDDEDDDRVFDQEVEPPHRGHEHQEHTVVVEHVPPAQEPDAPRHRSVPKPAESTGRGRRPAVPSWDEILFGTKKTD
jgi:hypothetical protein